MKVLIHKYFEIYKAFFKASMVADLEFRFNFFLLICAEFVWYGSQLIIYQVLYRHTKLIGGWDQKQMQVFMFLALFVDSIYMILWDSNFSKFNEDVRKGQLDLILTKPVNSMFITSSQKLSISHIPCFFVTLSGLLWSLNQLPDFSWEKILWMFIVIPSGLSVIFCGRFALNATALLFTRADFLQYVWYSLFRLGLRPDGIYSSFMNGALRKILIFILPFAMIASVPTRFLLEPLNSGLLLWTLVMPAALITLTHKYWTYCLKNYTSASS